MAITLGSLSLVPDSGQLVGPAGQTRLTPQPCVALQLLIERNGEMVSRKELMEAIWPGESFGISDRLTWCIHQLRQGLEAVGITGAVETVPRRGYRLIPVAFATAEMAEPERERADPLRQPVTRVPLIAAAVLLLTLAAAVWMTVATPEVDPHRVQHHTMHQARHATQ